MPTLADSYNLAALERVLVAREIRMLRAASLAPLAVALAAIAAPALPDLRPTARQVPNPRPDPHASATEIIAAIARNCERSESTIRGNLTTSKVFAPLREAAQQNDRCPLTQSARYLMWLEQPVTDHLGQSRSRYEMIADRWLSLEALLART